MYFLKRQINVILLVILVFATHSLSADFVPQASEKDGRLIVENNKIKRAFLLPAQENSFRFEPVSLLNKVTGSEMLQSEPASDWFRFGINSREVASSAGGWGYSGYTTRNMKHGGLEVKVQLEGKNRSNRNVQLDYYLQIFPDSWITRERIVISPAGEKPLEMSLVKKDFLLEFPYYTLRAKSLRNMHAQQLNLTTWLAEQQKDSVHAHWSYQDGYLEESGRRGLDERGGHNLVGSHMFQPSRTEFYYTPGREEVLRGPILLLNNAISRDGFTLMYEHRAVRDTAFEDYVKVHTRVTEEENILSGIRTTGGAYYPGEQVTANRPFSTLWTSVGLFTGDNFDAGTETIWHFLYHNISEDLASRQPALYYNSWGMQRDYEAKGRDVKEVLTEERLLEEIDVAAELGIEVFVIDDGWQKDFGDWAPDEKKFPNGFDKIKERLDKHGIRFGLWISPIAASQQSNLYNEHPEWIARDVNGDLIPGQQDHPMMCIMSGYYDNFLDQLKQLVDQGVSYFKWDALYRHACALPSHNHGDKNVSKELRAERQYFENILLYTSLAQDLTAYNDSVVIVLDATEYNRDVGLTFLSEARHFWMNNGASWYGDRSRFRTKSIRKIPALYNQIIPTVLQTASVYPHNDRIYGALRYAINTTILGTHGMWGDLTEIDSDDREYIGEITELYKRVANAVVATRPRVTGSVGSTPEVYEIVNDDSAKGEIIAFGGTEEISRYVSKPVNRQMFFCVVRNAYTLNDSNQIELPLSFREPGDTREAFVLNGAGDIQILSSSSWLKDAQYNANGSITYTNGAPGTQKIQCSSNQEPRISATPADKASYELMEEEGIFYITIKQTAADVQVNITP